MRNGSLHERVREGDDRSHKDEEAIATERTGSDLDQSTESILCVYVYVCMCVRQREREREAKISSSCRSNSNTSVVGNLSP